MQYQLWPNVLTLDIGDGKCVAEHHYEYSWADSEPDVLYKDYLFNEFFRNVALLRGIKVLKRVATALRLKPVIIPLYRKLNSLNK